ncbi:MAG: hypothetical protein ACTSWL_09685, partial [Promethearchaeota archaeon]
MSLTKEKELEKSRMELELSELSDKERSNQDEFASLESEIVNKDYDFTDHNVEMRLKKFGFRIPVLLVEQKEKSVEGVEKEFHLRRSDHDIYKEESFEEFQSLLSRLSGEDSSEDSDLVYFKLDYKMVWRGLTGTEMK